MKSNHTTYLLLILLLVPGPVGLAGEEIPPTSNTETNTGNTTPPLLSEFPHSVLTGNGEDGERFLSPEHIQVDDRGNLYVIDSHDTRLAKLDLDARVAWEVDGREWGGEGFLVPNAIGVSSGINLYLLDIGRREIFRLNSLGEIVGVVSTPGLEDPRAIALTETGKLVVYDASSVEMAVFSSSGTLLWSFRPEGYRSKRNVGMVIRGEEELGLYVKGGDVLRLYHFMGGLKKILKPKLPKEKQLKISSVDFGREGRVCILDGERPGLYLFDSLGNLLADLSGSLRAMGFEGPGSIQRWGESLYISDVRGGRIYELKVPADVF
jgi:hypothetical protein